MTLRVPRPLARVACITLPLLVLATLLAVYLGPRLLGPAKGYPLLSKRTVASGLPLTAEQKAMRFDHADLAIEVFPDRYAIAGKATLSFTALAPVKAVVFDLDRNLPISAIALDGKALPRSTWTNPEGMVTVKLPATLATGTKFALTVDYEGQPHVAVHSPWDGGFQWEKTPEGKPWIATAVEGEGCDIFWPCFDNPTVEIPIVDLHITVPDDLVAPSNGRLIGVTDQGGGRHTYHWRAKSPNNYAIALNIGPYRSISGTYRSRFGNSIPMTYWYLPGEEKQAKALFAEFAPTLDFFEETIGPYPFGDEKLGVVETPHLGMEHQTINAYGNGYKKAPEGYDWLFQHEFSHEWFGNQLTNDDWDHMWLHEGLGTYMQPLYAQWRNGEMNYMSLLFASRGKLMNKFPLVSGKSKTEEEVYQDKTGPGGDIYQKGSLVMHTLRQLIGDKAFFAAVRREVYGRPDPKPGNFTPRFGNTNEFVGYVNAETGKDLGWFFDIYLRQAALPRLVDTRSGDTVTLRWETPKNLPFPMPVEVAFDGRTVTVPMDGNKGTLTVPAGTHYSLDPMSKILRYSQDIEDYRAWQKAQDGKKKGKSS